MQVYSPPNKYPHLSDVLYDEIEYTGKHVLPVYHHNKYRYNFYAIFEHWLAARLTIPV